MRGLFLFVIASWCDTTCLNLPPLHRHLNTTSYKWFAHGTTVGMYGLVKRAQLTHEELDEEVLLTLLWMLEAW